MIHQVQQNTDEWFQLRMGKITSSNFGKIMANQGKAFGKPALDYAMRVAIESKTKVSIETYQNEWMEKGIEREQDARELYQDLTFTEVLPGGFCEVGEFGASADGLVDDGLIEIKSVKFNTHFERLIKGGYDTTYQWQIRGQMWIYDRPWCDFVSYCPEFPEGKQLYIFRVERDELLEQEMVERLNEFAAKVHEYIKVLEV
jgi:hypothetical protein